MAKQLTGFIEGCIDEVVFYKMQGEYYARMKSTLTGKRFWKDAAFEGSRKSCSRFADGNKLASFIYKKVDEEKRVYSLFLFLKKTAIALLKQNNTIEEAQLMLEAYLVDFGLLKEKTLPLSLMTVSSELSMVRGESCELSAASGEERKAVSCQLLAVSGEAAMSDLFHESLKDTGFFKMHF